MASKIIRAASGHTMCVSSVSVDDFKMFNIPGMNTDHYTKFYIVQNWDRSGVVFMYMAKGYHTPHITTAKAAKEVHVWYAKSKTMWSSMGNDLKSAIDGAQSDGWLHA